MAVFRIEKTRDYTVRVLCTDRNIGTWKVPDVEWIRTMKQGAGKSCRLYGRCGITVADLSEFWRGEDEIKLLDPNLLACPDHEALLEQLAASRALVDFTQGLDIRLTNPDNITLLNRVRTKAVHFAWDNPEEDLTEHFKRFVAHTAIRSDRNRRVYVLTNYGSTHEQDLYRVNTLQALGYDPYVMIYERPTAPRITRHLQRWVNNKRIFHTVKDFKDYAPMKKEVH